MNENVCENIYKEIAFEQPYFCGLRNCHVINCTYDHRACSVAGPQSTSTATICARFSCNENTAINRPKCYDFVRISIPLFYRKSTLV